MRVKARKFEIGDAVVHIRGDPVGIIVDRQSNGLLKVRWESRVHEWVPPKELRLLKH